MLFLLSSPALALVADEAAPVLYSRGSISIQRQAAPPPMPWQPADAPRENTPVEFGVDIRDGMTMYNQQGWFNLSSPSEDGGTLMAFTAPGLAPIIRLAQYAPLDILLIDRAGIITQIIPNIILANLPHDITPETPVLAVLFLKGGSCERLSIHPGDRVQHPLFAPPTTVLSAPKPQVTITETPPAPATPPVITDVPVPKQ
jgi:uncharacterized membrane protein (UPF0127 family)